MYSINGTNVPVGVRHNACPEASGHDHLQNIYNKKRHNNNNNIMI
jgi:hypothetical protein